MYNSNEKALIWLTLFDFMTAKKISELLDFFNEPKDIFSQFESKKSKLASILNDEHLLKMENSLDENLLKSYLASLDEQNITCITLVSEKYPENLKDIYLPPYVLFCKGNTELLETRCIGIVGTRVPTSYGKSVTQSFSKGLAENDLTIVSGLAMGVDKIAHETALETEGKTIAVLGGGFNHIYPAMNINLAKQISEKGLLVSEYRPSVAPQAYNFPVRNRIIAGLSMGVLITEAGEKSGALHTKEYALESGRDVFAVPGNITSEKSAGTNRLIKSMQTALVTSFKDILEFYSITPKKEKKQQKQLGFNEQIILKCLKNEEKTFEEIGCETGLEIKILNSCLTSLQISGLIKKLPGNIYILIRQ